MADQNEKKNAPSFAATPKVYGLAAIQALVSDAAVGAAAEPIAHLVNTGYLGTGRPAFDKLDAAAVRKVAEDAIAADLVLDPSDPRGFGPWLRERFPEPAKKTPKE